MIDPQRVCEMTKLAAYEEKEGKKYRQAMQFYRSDFVGRHLLKGFFCATIAYGLLLLAWGVCRMDELMENMASMESVDLIQFGIAVLVRYLLFLIVYLIAVDIYANLFYAAGRRNQRRHLRRLRRLQRIYKEQEERTAPGHYDD